MYSNSRDDVPRVALFTRTGGLAGHVIGVIRRKPVNKSFGVKEAQARHRRSPFCCKTNAANVLSATLPPLLADVFAKWAYFRSSWRIVCGIQLADLFFVQSWNP